MYQQYHIYIALHMQYTQYICVTLDNHQKYYYRRRLQQRERVSKYFVFVLIIYLLLIATTNKYHGGCIQMSNRKNIVISQLVILLVLVTQRIFHICFKSVESYLYFRPEGIFRREHTKPRRDGVTMTGVSVILYNRTIQIDIKLHGCCMLMFT